MDSHDPDRTLLSGLRHYAKDHPRRGFGPRITTPAQKPGQSIMRKCNAFGAKRASDAIAPPAQSPRQLHRTADRNRGCTQFGCRRRTSSSTSPPTGGRSRSSQSSMSTPVSLGRDGPATATGRSRTDPYSVTPLGAAGASRSAATRISRRIRCRGVQRRRQDRRCPTLEHR